MAVVGSRRVVSKGRGPIAFVARFGCSRSTLECVSSWSLSSADGSSSRSWSMSSADGSSSRSGTAGRGTGGGTDGASSLSLELPAESSR